MARRKRTGGEEVATFAGNSPANVPQNGQRSRFCGLAPNSSTQNRGEVRAFVDLHPTQVHKHEKKLRQMFHKSAKVIITLRMCKGIIEILRKSDKNFTRVRRKCRLFIYLLALAFAKRTQLNAIPIGAYS